MFNQMMEGVKATPNNEWKYLLRVLAIAGLIAFVVYKLWFSWWVGDSFSVQTEGVTVGFTEKDISFIRVDGTTIIDRDTKDILSCVGEIPISCVHTGYNCSNIGSFDLWLRPKENAKRCQSTTTIREEYKASHRVTTIPTCTNGQRLWFVPATKQYFCK